MELNLETGTVLTHRKHMKEKIVVQMTARFRIAVSRYLVQLLVVGPRGVTGLSAPPRVKRRVCSIVTDHVTVQLLKTVDKIALAT
ncbi:hypothetical protein DPMN_004013 [Dreissena polymorpha]|uniref:Uncharacterized protein n=1 Tax=Dreissena polymorpha TaxID=45954 RepID=A0A9D4MMN6_DREPO|nr:hypothetical protein DPMN_004013 [Dreissena polymorpha]